MSSRKITNTTAAVDADPMSFLAEAFILGGSGAIEAMESRGQAELVASEQVPTDFDRNLGDTFLERIGLVLGPPTPGDPMFRAATLPPGWTRRRTDHPMWSEILDDRGRVRLDVFYKAASYDRVARMSARCRFGWRTDYGKPEAGVNRVCIADAGREVHPIGSYQDADWDGRDVVMGSARSWLEANRPDWQDPAAYWEDDS